MSMVKRLLGRTGEMVSIFGFGGIVVENTEQKDANNIVAEAVDRGINYFDVAPSYGNAQYILGPALEPYRNKVFLACKTGERTKEGAARELRESLKALHTDHFDTYQFHGIDDPEEIKTMLGPNGALEAVVEAKKEGLVRFIGFSCHIESAAMTLLDAYDFDSVLFPINWAYWLKRGAGKKVLDIAKSKNMARIAMKGLAYRHWKEGEERTYPKCWYKPIYDDPYLASLALRFTLSKPVCVALSPGDVRMLRLGLDIVEKTDNFGELSKEELDFLKKRAGEIDEIFSDRQF